MSRCAAEHNLNNKQAHQAGEQSHIIFEAQPFFPAASEGSFNPNYIDQLSRAVPQ